MTRADAPLAVTLGEPAGIGPDLVLAAWREVARGTLPRFVVHGDADALARRARDLGWDIPITGESRTGDAGALRVKRTERPMRGRPGEPTADDAPAVIEAIEAAVAAVAAGEAAGIVTAPIQKRTLYEAGFRYAGHTDYLGALAQQHWGGVYEPVMMLAAPTLRTVPVTVHVPLRRVPDLLTRHLIVSVGRTVARDLVRFFAIERPRLVLAGLNPHAGEEGTIGDEDETVVRPAAEALRAEGLDVTGPLSADTLFTEEARQRYDAVLAMYHDQALVPIKTIAFDEAVNMTLGLPFVRTSPDHGTALSLAGTGSARPGSFFEALRLAARAARSVALQDA